MKKGWRKTAAGGLKPGEGFPLGRKNMATKELSGIVRKYLDNWKDEYALKDECLEILFKRTFRKNTDIKEVLIKVSVLNSFYSTNIFDLISVAKRIIELDIDKYLEEGNLDIVNSIAKVAMKKDKVRFFYSFATKYCSFHNPETYAIYDSYVVKALKHYRDEDKFAEFNDDTLKDYRNFIDVILKFKSFYELNEFSLKQIDMFLWQAGKEGKYGI